jgi:hypothetical protein
MDDRVERDAQERKGPEAARHPAQQRLEDAVLLGERLRVAARLARLLARARRLGTWTLEP